jgi:FKBP-type peptidyl-prolyl cis-trans isomerase FkpA
MTNFSVKTFAVALASLAVLSACNNTSYKKTSSGLMYKIYSKGSGPLVKPGEVLKVHYVQKINDSLLFDSHGKMPAYAKVDSAAAGQYSPAEIFPLLHKGDSAVIVQLVDSLMKSNPMGLPPYMKKGDKLTISFRVVEVFSNDDFARADGEEEMKKERERMEKEVAEKTVEMAKEMETYLAEKFESNITDTTRPAFNFMLGTGQVIPGWDEGLKLLKKGAKATLYIPGSLAYGPRPGPGGKTYESLIFDVELVDVTDSMPAHP